MKKFVLGGLVAVFAAAPAMAADVPVRKAPARAPAPVVAVYNWTGLYLGAHAGYIWGKANLHDVNSYNGPPDFDYKPKGFLGGLHAGYNWQSNMLVLGVELEGGYMGLRGSAQYPPYVGVRTAADSVAETKDSWYAAFTGRLGLALNNFLIYGKGGWAVTGIKSSFTDTDPTGTTLVSGTETGRRSGWTVGGGVEYGFSPNWTARVEYAHYDFGTASHTATSAGGGSFTFDHRLRADSIRAGLTYRWGAAAPVVARY